MLATVALGAAQVLLATSHNTKSFSSLHPKHFSVSNLCYSLHWELLAELLLDT